MYQEFSKAIPNPTLRPDVPITYKNLQQVITEDDSRRMIKHFIRKRAPCLGGKVENIQKQIYDLQFISS